MTTETKRGTFEIPETTYTALMSLYSQIHVKSFPDDTFEDFCGLMLIFGVRRFCEEAKNKGE